MTESLSRQNTFDARLAKSESRRRDDFRVEKTVNAIDAEMPRLQSLAANLKQTVGDMLGDVRSHRDKVCSCSVAHCMFC